MVCEFAGVIALPSMPLTSALWMGLPANGDEPYVAIVTQIGESSCVFGHTAKTRTAGRDEQLLLGFVEGNFFDCEAGGNNE